MLCSALTAACCLQREKVLTTCRNQPVILAEGSGATKPTDKLSWCAALRACAVAVQVFLTSTRLFLETRPGDVGAAVFDKDDALAVEFVTAASNLRALCYNIPTQSLFAAKVGLKDQRPAFCY